MKPIRLKLPARMPIRTYNRDFDVPRRQARRGLFDPKVEQGPLELYHNLAWVRCKAPARGLTRSECGARDWLRVAEEEVVPVALSHRVGRSYAALAAARPVGRIELCSSQIHRACTPATGVAGGRTRRAVSVLSWRAAPKNKGEKKDLIGPLSGPHPGPPKIPKLPNTLRPLTCRYARPQRVAQRQGTGPPSYTCSIGGAGHSSLNKGALTEKTRTLKQTTISAAVARAAVAESGNLKGLGGFLRFLGSMGPSPTSHVRSYGRGIGCMNLWETWKRGEECPI